MKNELIASRQLSTTFQRLENTVFRCDVCLGRGHEFWECGSKRRLDKWAKANGDQKNWGKVKYNTYFRFYTAAEGRYVKA